ncbi:hypothetical protein [Streptomyces chiangmaiensis]|uniref:Uncharacterized protein n=1 Tax=Streptomyces chiangmaiensis TaxID=766497 RepID=A0ABU7FN32_9ACTN|nr:hypothetical protein [Streptomyces chiangmaiensis]MED7825448.1 hypothetical protein [Streptomyces chiangmaiensis]
MFLILSAVILQDAFLSWGWRVPFLLSIFLIGVGLYAQSRIEETHAAQRCTPSSGRPTRSLSIWP